MTSESKSLNKKNILYIQGLKPKLRKTQLELHFNSYVLHDIKISLRILELFALRSGLALNHRKATVKNLGKQGLKTYGTVREPEKAVFVARQSHEALKTLAFLNLASKINRKIKSKCVLTVLRSPFVYKKTREQFAFQQHCYVVKLQCPYGVAELLVHLFSQLRLPAELKIHLKA